MTIFRELLEKFDRGNELKRVTKEVDPIFEAAAILRKMDRLGGPAVLFEKIKGHNLKAVGNLLSTRERMAAALGLSRQQLRAETLSDVLSPTKEEKETFFTLPNSPVKEVKVKDSFDLYQELPLFTYSTREGEPAITSGVLFSRDLENPRPQFQLIEFHRLGPAKLGMGVGPPMSLVLGKAEASGRPLDVVIAFGVPGEVLLSACAFVIDPAMDRMTMAFALRKDKLPMIKGDEVDILFPAEAEVALEGVVIPGKREKVGPLEESVIELKAITRKEDAVIPSLIREGRETALLGGISLEMGIYRWLRTSFPVKSLHIPPSSWALHAIISMKKTSDEMVKSLMAAVLGITPIIKHVIVVDEDVDIMDMDQVQWAIATRFQADRDLLVLKDVAARPSDPTASLGTGSKMGLDATRSFKIPRERFEPEKIPEQIWEKVEKQWDGYFGGERR